MVSKILVARSSCILIMLVTSICKDIAQPHSAPARCTYGALQPWRSVCFLHFIKTSPSVAAALQSYCHLTLRELLSKLFQSVVPDVILILANTSTTNLSTLRVSMWSFSYLHHHTKKQNIYSYR